jgi:hypothetical protein
MKKMLFIAGLLMFGLASCDNAASKIKSEEEKSSVSSEVQPAAQAQQVQNQAAATGALPKFSFDTEAHDFGSIVEGTVAKHDFTFTNTGDAPLIITNASGSCGCTVPSWPREPIAPGETGTIHVEFNSTNRTGNQTKQVTLSANTVPNKKVLRINAQVQPKADKDGQEANS